MSGLIPQIHGTEHIKIEDKTNKPQSPKPPQNNPQQDHQTKPLKNNRLISPIRAQLP